MKTSSIFALSLCALMLTAVPSLRADDLLVHDGDTLAYLWDRGAPPATKYPNGFIQLVKDGLARSGAKTDFLEPLSDHRLMVNMGAIYPVLQEKKPQWLIFFGSSQDVVWRFPKKIGLDHDSYKELIRKQLDRYLETGTKVLLLGCTPSGETLEGVDNVHMVFCNEFLRELAAEKGVPFADPFPELIELYKTPEWAEAKKAKTTERLTHLVVAKAILRGLGLSQETIDSYVAEWNTWPAKCNYEILFTVDEYRALESIAHENGKETANDFFIPVVREMILGKDAQ